eukprot:UN14538
MRRSQRERKQVKRLGVDDASDDEPPRKKPRRQNRRANGHVRMQIGRELSIQENDRIKGTIRRHIL